MSRLNSGPQKPLPHAASHAEAAADVLTPAAIGAAPSPLDMEFVEATGAVETDAPVVLVDASLGDVDLTLPAAPSDAWRTLKLIRFDDPATNVVTILPQEGGAVGGGASIALTTPWQVVSLLGTRIDGADFWIYDGAPKA